MKKGTYIRPSREKVHCAGMKRLLGKSQKEKYITGRRSLFPRTVKVLVLAVLMLFRETVVFGQESDKDLDLYARSALLMDASNGRVLYEENGYAIMPMASTTKIMTCILALEYGNLEDTVTVSSYAASMPKVKLYLKAGEQYCLGDLLYSLMLQSHNDSAVAVAEHIGGSVEGFAALMNQKARDLGCTDTTFVTPNGLDGVNAAGEAHSTTAYDMAKIASYAIQNEQFREIITTRSYSFSSIKGGRSFTVNNADAFLDMMPGAIGIKTGYTGEAGYCFVGALEDNGRTYVSVVLACGWPPNKSYKWHDTKLLMAYGLDNFDYRNIEVQHEVSDMPVIQGQEACVGLTVEAEDFSVLLAEGERIRWKRELPQSMEAPIEAGTVAGYDKYYIEGTLYRTYPIYTTESVKRIDYPYCLNRILEKILL